VCRSVGGAVVHHDHLLGDVLRSVAAERGDALDQEVGSNPVEDQR
jgi:hypothetical protein